MPNVTPAKRSSKRNWPSVRSGSMPTSRGQLVRRRHLAAHARLHQRKLDGADAQRVDVVLRERRQARDHHVGAEAVHRQRRLAVLRHALVELGERCRADHQQRVAVGEQRVRAANRPRTRDCTAARASGRSARAARRSRARQTASRPRRRPHRSRAPRCATPRPRGRRTTRRVPRRAGERASGAASSSAPSPATATRTSASRGCSRWVTNRPSPSTTIHSRSATPSCTRPVRGDRRRPPRRCRGSP